MEWHLPDTTHRTQNDGAPKGGVDDRRKGGLTRKMESELCKGSPWVGPVRATRVTAFTGPTCSRREDPGGPGRTGHPSSVLWSVGPLCALVDRQPFPRFPYLIPLRLSH